MSTMNSNPPNLNGDSSLFSNDVALNLNQQPHSQAQMGSGLPFPNQYHFYQRRSPSQTHKISQPAHVQFLAQLKPEEQLSLVQQQSGLGNKTGSSSPSAKIPGNSNLKCPTQDDNTTNPPLRLRDLHGTAVRKRKHRLLLDKQGQDRFSKTVSSSTKAVVKVTTLPIAGTKRMADEPQGNDAKMVETCGRIKTSQFKTDLTVLKPCRGQDSEKKSDEHMAVGITTEISSDQVDPSVERNQSSTHCVGQKEIPTITGVMIPSMMGLSDDEVIAKAKLTREAILSQAKAIHPLNKELLLLGFVHFLRSLFSLSKDTSVAELKQLVDMANDCASWGFNTEGALQRIRMFQKKRELEERRKKIEAETAEMMAAVAKLQAEQERIKADEAAIAKSVDSSPEFNGVFEGFGL